MHYMIHACPERMWYVEKYLYPSLLDQGIATEEIEIRNDREGKGNLISCMESFAACGEREGGTWHLQDDVLICRNFARRTKEHDKGIVCGFMSPRSERRRETRAGMTTAAGMWWSFQCIRIPDKLAGECAAWFFSDAMTREAYREKEADGKHDDMFFRDFLLERHPEYPVRNLAPNLADHIDLLIGGSRINRERGPYPMRSGCWEDNDLVGDLEKALREQPK